MRNSYLKSLLLCLLFSVLMFSCGKEIEEEVDMDSNTTLDNANSQAAFDDVLKLAEDVLTVNSAAKTTGNGNGVSCATVDSIKYSPTHYLFTITFNGACLLYDNRIRTGKLSVELKGAGYNSPGAEIIIKSLGYTVNGFKISGKKVLTCVSSTVHDIIVSDTTGNGYAKITYPNGDTTLWRSLRTRTLVDAGVNGSITDNVYDISATPSIGNPCAEGINREGRHYVVDIKTPVRVDFNCTTNNTARFPTQGIVELYPDDKKMRSVDYGAGSCDNSVVVSVGSKSFNVEL